MISIILSAIILCHCELSEVPSDNSLLKIADTNSAENVDSETSLEKSDVAVLEMYPVLVPPNLMIRICLKDTSLLDKLHANVNDCDNYSCMFSKIIADESMESVVSIIRDDTMDKINQEFKQSIHDCAIWWKLFKHFNENANPRHELGKCLFQTFSSKCREPVLDKIRLFLVTTEETKSY